MCDADPENDHRDTWTEKQVGEPTHWREATAMVTD